MDKTITIHNKPEINDLAKAYLYLLLSLPVIYIIPTIVVFTSVMNSTSLHKHEENALNPLWSPVIAVLVLLAFFLFLKKHTKKAITKNGKSLEPQQLFFEEKGFSVAGETYHTNYIWADIHKIKETKSWFLIYTQKMAALPVRKDDLSEKQYIELKQLFHSLPVKKKLFA